MELRLTHQVCLLTHSSYVPFFHTYFSPLLGNVYIGDWGNNRVRKVTVSSGIISTIAGKGTNDFSGDNGQATSAELNKPWGVALDSLDNVYFADYYNNRIRKVTVSTGVITTIAGSGSAGYGGDNSQATSATLNYPTGVAVDSTGRGNLITHLISAYLTTPFKVTYISQII